MGFCVMARSGGFEPPTAWFVARYSIQLSYERAKLLNCMILDIESGLRWTFLSNVLRTITL